MPPPRPLSGWRSRRVLTLYLIDAASLHCRAAMISRREADYEQVTVCRHERSRSTPRGAGVQGPAPMQLRSMVPDFGLSASLNATLHMMMRRAGFPSF